MAVHDAPGGGGNPPAGLAAENWEHHHSTATADPLALRSTPAAALATVQERLRETVARHRAISRRSQLGSDHEAQRILERFGRLVWVELTRRDGDR